MGRPHRLRVLHVVEAVEAGVLRHVADLVGEIDAEHHVALPDRRRGGMTDLATLERLRGLAAATHRVPMARSTSSRANLAAIAHVRRLVRSEAPDVVHGHSTVGGAVARLAIAGTGIPAVYTPNGLSPRRAVRAAERALGPLTTAFVAVSDSEAELALRRRLVGPDRLSVVPNGIDPTPPPPADPPLHRRIGVPADVPVVVSVGRLVRQKAPSTTIAAWGRVAARRSDVHFAWIGDGELRAAADAAVATSGAADRIHLLGQVDGAAALLPGCAAFTLASTFEGGPYAVLEAMRVGVPVVATDVVGTRDCVVHRQTGLLVPPGAPDALAEATLRLLGDGALRERLATAARRAVEDRFSVHLMGRRTAAVYRAVARRAS